MNHVKILHCADFHLGSEFASLKGKGRERKQDLLRTFQRVLSLCKTEGVHFLLIAGDLFDSVNVPADILELVRAGFAALTPTVVAIAPGNHDPYTIDSPYARKDYWPDNVFIFTGELTSLDFPELGVRLWGAAFTGAYQRDPLLPGQLRADPGAINLGVLHGSLAQDGQGSDYNPVWRESIRSSGLDYLALGHEHKFSEIRKADGVQYAYSGCPEGRGFDELGEKGVILGTVATRFSELELVPVCGRKYLELPVDITETPRLQIAPRIRQSMEERWGESYRGNLYKVILQGDLDGDAWWSPDSIRAELADVFYCKLVDRTTLSIENDGPMDDMTLRSIFIRRMTEQIADSGDPEAARLALKLGLRAFTQKVDYDED